VLGVDLESTPLIALAVLAGLGLAAVTATRVGRLRGFLVTVAAIALVWALLDVREVVHQLDCGSRPWESLVHTPRLTHQPLASRARGYA
jgi:hypothetical protein